MIHKIYVCLQTVPTQSGLEQPKVDTQIHLNPLTVLIYIRHYNIVMLLSNHLFSVFMHL